MDNFKACVSKMFRIKFLYYFWLVMMLATSAFANPANDVTRQWRDSLIDAGWEPAAARRVVSLNAEWFDILRQEYPRELERQQAILTNLGEFSYLMPFIKKHPETASLLAAADDPKRFADVFGKDACYPYISGLFVQYADPLDSRALSLALENQRDLICRLAQRGIVGSEALFLYPRNAEFQAYQQWLQETLELGLSGKDEELSSLINLLFEQGETIRERMQRDADFRRDFRPVLWPSLKRVARDTGYSYELFLNDKYLWDLLTLSQGEDILRKWALLGTWGLSPSDLLLGAEAYPPEMHAHIVEALLEGDENTLMALLQFGKEPLFIELVKRPVPSATKNAAYAQLFAAQGNYTAKLEYFASLSDAALRKELGERRGGIVMWLPGYSVYELLEKLAEGRNVGALDVTFAGWEIIDAAILISSGISIVSLMPEPKPSMFCRAGIGCDLESLIKKVMTGSKLSKADILLGGLDAVDIPLSVLTFSPKLTLLKEGGKRLSKKGLKRAITSLSEQILERMGQDKVTKMSKETARQLAYQLAKSIIRRAVREGMQELTEHIGKKLGQELAQQMSQDALNVWARRQLLIQMQKTLGKTGAKKSVYDITPLVQSIFKKLRPAVNRETFKRLIDLEARLFMRSDARVLVAVEKAEIAPVLTEFFRRTLTEGAQEYSTRFGVQAPQAWQKNLSAWWLLNMDGMGSRIGGLP